MSKMKILFFVLLAAKTSWAGQKTSLQNLLQGLPESEISQEFVKPLPDVKKIHLWLDASKKVRGEFEGLVKSSSAFIRGEIEQEKLINTLTVFMQLALLQCRAEVLEKRDKACSSQVPLWFNFSADLVYEEGSLIALRLVHLLRSLWLDELESQYKKNPQFLSSTQDWIWSLRAPWPVERVFVHEGRKVLQPVELQIVEKIAKDYQQNPYQTAEQMLKKVPGGKLAGVEFIKKIWRAEDLEAMKIEINRMNVLRVRAAQSRFFQMRGKTAESFEDLVKAKLMTTIPVDYLTGRAMSFP
jgi:hypothetical protein